MVEYFCSKESDESHNQNLDCKKQNTHTNAVYDYISMKIKEATNYSNGSKYREYC